MLKQGLVVQSLLRGLAVQFLPAWLLSPKPAFLLFWGAQRWRLECCIEVENSFPRLMLVLVCLSAARVLLLPVQPYAPQPLCSLFHRLLQPSSAQAALLQGLVSLQVQDLASALPESHDTLHLKSAFFQL